jgi:hypothetical protein
MLSIWECLTSSYLSPSSEAGIEEKTIPVKLHWLGNINDESSALAHYFAVLESLQFKFAEID